MFQTIKYEVKDQIAYLTINKPETLNALDGQVLSEISAAVDMIKTDEQAKALILTGQGRAFAAGADIGAQSLLDMEGGRQWGRKGSAIFRNLEILPVPTIAAVNGFALGGGCELAMACDMILASEKAKFGQPEVSLGITPGFSGTQRLARKVGKAECDTMLIKKDFLWHKKDAAWQKAAWRFA